MNEPIKRIALLIDYDNFNNEEDLDILLKELNKEGQLVVTSIAYISNTETTGKKVKDKWIKFNLTPKLCVGYGNNKNVADIEIAIDSMELLNKDFINSFCYATNDSDFSSIIKKVKSENKFVIGASSKNMSDTYTSLCDEFISVNLIKEAKKKKSDLVNKDINELVNKIKNFFVEQNKQNSKLYLSQISEFLKKDSRNFNPKNYGASNSKLLSFFEKELSSFFNVIRDKDNTTYYISIKSK